MEFLYFGKLVNKIRPYNKNGIGLKPQEKINIFESIWISINN